MLNMSNSIRIVENRCCRVRVEMEGKAYQCFSIMLTHPSMVKEDEWCRLHVNGEWILIDKLSMSVLSKCVVEWLTVPEQHTIQACRLGVPDDVEDPKTFWDTLVL
tara:strand:+ start:647 stop:961 length:315 start_codon:yes stop_codon:yes gene_type:complete